jgi:hypothetical protein
MTLLQDIEGNSMPLNPASDEFVRTAAFLKREFEGRNATVAFTEANRRNRVVYAFDTDIIKTKCAPWIKGPKGERDNNGYGSIFADEIGSFTSLDSSQQAKKAESVAHILADYILHYHHKGIEDGHKGSKDAPIFQFPSHAVETNNVYRAVRRSVEMFESVDFRKTQSRKSFELSRAIALVRHYATLGVEKDDARELIDKIVNWLTYGDQPGSQRTRKLQEWDNYYELEAEFGGIYSLADAAAFYPNEPKVSDAFSVLHRGNRSSEEEDAYQKLIDHWTGILQRMSRHNIQADAEALASLFLVNARFLGSNWKCVFVTGDRALARAAYGLIPLYKVPEQSTSLVERFSLDHIRHLWAYSSDALIEPGKQQTFVDLFSGLLANWSGELSFQIKDIEDLAIRTPQPGRHIPEHNLRRALTEWETLTEKSITRHALEEYEKHEQLQDAIWNKVNRLMRGGSWEDLQNLLQEEVDRIRDRAILSMSDLGVDVIIQADKLGRRNPPDLIFDSLKNTNAIFKQLSVPHGYTNDPRYFEADLAKIKLDCHDSTRDGDDRQESHLKFLVLGAAFASAERWLIALNHAKRAIGIIQRSAKYGLKIPVRHDGSTDGTKSHMSGREAYFLAAVAQRMLAAHDSDFNDALGYLKKSERALEEDHRNKTALKITTSRFEGERLAIALSRYYLARSLFPSDYKNSFVDDIYRNANRVASLFSDWNSGNDPNSLRNATIVNFSVNIIQTFVISEFRQSKGFSDKACPVNADIVIKAIAAIKNLTTFEKSQSDQINATRLIRTYTIVGEILTTASPSQAVKLYDKLLRLLGNLEEAVVTRYDEWRYQALIDFVKSRLGLP